MLAASVAVVKFSVALLAHGISMRSYRLTQRLRGKFPRSAMRHARAAMVALSASRALLARMDRPRWLVHALACAW